MAFVDHHHRIVRIGDVAYLVHLGHDAVHRKRSVADDEHAARALAAGLFYGLFQRIHIVVLVAVAPGFGQPDAVDDGGMVELVRHDGILLACQRLEQPPIGIKGGGVKDGVFHAHEAGDGGLKLLVQVLRAADEAHAGKAEAVGIQRMVGGGQHLGVGRKAQVVVGTEIQQCAPAHLDFSALRAGDDGFGFPQALGLNAGKLLDELFANSGIHGWRPMNEG